MLKTHPQFIHAEVSDYASPPWLLTIVYGSTNPVFRKILWKDINHNRVQLVEPWMIVGNFNSVMDAEEISSPGRMNQRKCLGFTSWIFEHGLLDLGFTGPKFRWTRGKTPNTFTGARLDRALSNTNWRIGFPDAEVNILPKINSDHSPMLISISGSRHYPNSKQFKFQVAWLLHQRFHNLVHTHWTKEISFTENNRVIANRLTDWNKEQFGHIEKRKKRLWARLAGIQKAMMHPENKHLFKLERKLKKDLEVTLNQEEMFWFQRSREEWIALGDRNTKYYHAATTIRKHKNTIKGLLNDQRIWTTDPVLIAEMIKRYFHGLFSREPSDIHPNSIPNGFPNLHEEHLRILQRPFTKEEVKRALFDMAPFKSPGNDGLHAGFFQKSWAIVGKSLCEYVLKFLDSGVHSKGSNDTLLVLILKVNNPESLTKVRPISLCNVGYKTFTKTLTNRLKEVMPHLTAPSQSSFVPGQQIINNIIIYQEVLHFHAQPKKG